ncbi:MAG: alpha/beta hydrolase [Anaerolineae bacterium]|nr:alpha/beta hydrolase [Anaerolineae bacterium]
MSAVTRFKSPKDAERFFAAYDAALALWPIAHESLKVATRYGMTHVNIAGSADLPPLFLLHGAQICSTVWYANVGALSRHFRIHAPDVVDQMGRSLPTQKLKTPQDCSNWLCDLMDGLGVERSSIAGNSQGGWLAINLAVNAPQRVEKLILLSPSGSIGRVHWQTFVHLLPVLLRPTKAMFYWNFQWLTTMPLGEVHPLAEQFMIGALSFKPQELSFGTVSVFSDDQLRGLTMPTLLLIGEQDGTCRPQAELNRARRLIPNLQAELVAGGGHLFPVDQADTTNARLLAFLNESTVHQKT